MEEELRRIADDLDKVVMLFEQLDQRFGAVPTTLPPTPPPPAYLSGRWKLRDGTMYGR